MYNEHTRRINKTRCLHCTTRKSIRTSAPHSRMLIFSSMGQFMRRKFVGSFIIKIHASAAVNATCHTTIRMIVCMSDCAYGRFVLYECRTKWRWCWCHRHCSFDEHSIRVRCACTAHCFYIDELHTLGFHTNAFIVSTRVMTAG